jgi:mannosyl-3-phosphoglycerate phosphatase
MLLIFSDLDGTLLDSNYSHDAAAPALAAAEIRGIPIILSSSKTLAEMESVRLEMGNNHPFIPENGGASVIPANYFPFETPGERGGEYEAIRFGTPYPELVATLRQLSRETGIAVRGFSDMTPEDVAEATGLPLQQARLAKQREYDEPFTVTGSQPVKVLLQAIEGAGLRWTRGGRFFHILGANDKAMAASAIRECYARLHPQLTTVALGDAPNDCELLRFADIPVIVGSAYTQELAALVPTARITRITGSAGWNEAVLDIVRESMDGHP